MLCSSKSLCALSSNNPGHGLEGFGGNVKDLAEIIESTLHIGLPTLANKLTFLGCFQQLI
jgi:hypothetical protein